MGYEQGRRARLGLRSCAVAFVVTLALGTIIVSDIAAEGATPQGQRLCREAPCDRVIYDGPVSTSVSEEEGSWAVMTLQGEWTVPATIRRWGVWRVHATVQGAGENTMARCWVEQSVSPVDALGVAEGIEGQAVARRLFGHGVRETVGRLADRNLELVGFETRRSRGRTAVATLPAPAAWTHEWDVELAARHQALCWVLEAHVEATLHWDRLSTREWMEGAAESNVLQDAVADLGPGAPNLDFSDPTSVVRETMVNASARQRTRVFRLATEIHASTTVADRRQPIP